MISLKKIPQGRGSDKPVRVPLPNPLYSVEETETCLFVKDHKGMIFMELYNMIWCPLSVLAVSIHVYCALHILYMSQLIPYTKAHKLQQCTLIYVLLFATGEGHKESKAKVKAEKIPGIAKVIGISKLKTKYESHEAKRQLCDSYDLFLADDRIIPSLPKLIGKSFFKKKKLPIPVKLSGKDWASQVRKACDATYMHVKGSSITIRVAKASQTEFECVENVVSAIKEVSGKVPGKFKAIKSLFLKSLTSAALPIYQTE